MNEQHMRVVERALLNLSGARKKLRSAADELEADSAEAHLVTALRQADREAEAVYKRLFQGAYFHVSDEQLADAASTAADPGEQPTTPSGTKPIDVPEPAEELRLFRAEESRGSAKK